MAGWPHLPRLMVRALLLALVPHPAAAQAVAADDALMRQITRRMT